MAEYKTEKQVNYGWGLSLEMTGKAPAIAKRIFETLSDAQAYADDINDSAIAGLQLSVINDEDSSKNGLYFVKSIGDGTNAAVLELIGKGTEFVDNSSVDLTEYAKTEDIQNWVIDQNYLTEHQDLSDYVTKTDIAEYAKIEDIPSIDGLATKDWVIEKITEAELNDKDVDLSNYVTKGDLTGYAKIEDVPSISGLATETFVTESISAIDIPSIDGLATEEWVTDKIKEIDLSDYATKEFVEESVPDFFNGLEQIGTTVGVKIDSESESFISASNAGIKLSGIQETIESTFDTYLNTQGFSTRTVYLTESEWDALKNNVESGNASWENNVIYMVYSDD